jgi:shikimate dehydrogenase
MKRFGLIGHPIAHSLSPALFKAGYDGKYPYELIETADFDEAYIRFLNGYEGINVTAPFKELAYARADILSDECRIIKATNLLIRTPEGIKAYNSDYLGVRMWLQEVEERVARFSLPLPPPASTSVLIIGTGGAGKAAAVAAASLGMDLVLMNRSMEKAEAVAESISQMQDAPYAEVRPMEDFRECFRDADIIIYNIPSAVPALSELTAEDFGTGKQKFIMEANYKDPSFDNELIMKMKQANPLASYTSGKVWLLYQALTGYEIFTGERPDLARMTAVI